MHKFIEKIKQFEQKPFAKENFFNTEEIDKLIRLYFSLPIEIDNKRQKIIKKKWTIDFSLELQNIYKNKLNTLIGSFEMDNPVNKDGQESLGLFQESFLPVSLHVDTGFDFDKIIYKQILVPLTNEGETVIFKNRFYGCSTTFSIKKRSWLQKDTIKDPLSTLICIIKNRLTKIPTRNF